MVQLDPINLRLLALLQRDARAGVTELARALGRAESTVRERLVGLERAGIILGYRAVLDPTQLGYRVHAWLRADGERQSLGEVEAALRAVAHVTQAGLTTGPKPLLIEVEAESLARLGMVEERLEGLGLGGLETAVEVRSLVPQRPVPVAALHDDALDPSVVPPGRALASQGAPVQGPLVHPLCVMAGNGH